MIWGLACGGEKGATAVLQLMKSEIDQALALAGKNLIESLIFNSMEYHKREPIKLDSFRYIFFNRLQDRIGSDSGNGYARITAQSSLIPLLVLCFYCKRFTR